jgi:hypothetical protein
MKKKIATFETDQQAQEFVNTVNLAEYDLSGGTPVQFEFEAKAAHKRRKASTCIRHLKIQKLSEY